MNVGLGAKRLSQFIDFQRQSDQVFLLSVKHVVADPFRQRLEEVGLFDHVEVLLGGLAISGTTSRVLRHIVVLLLRLLNVFLNSKSNMSGFSSRCTFHRTQSS